jgi:hypothetical protein
MQEQRKIFFNEELHRYTDSLNNVYTSTTTIISKYYDKFKSKEVADACEKIGKNPNHPKYLKYKGKSAKQLIWEWENKSEEACAKGTKTHNYLEQSVKDANNYNKIKHQYTNDRIYTINEILDNQELGRLNLEDFIKCGVKDRYPDIYSIIESFVNNGYRIYAEIGVFNPLWLISGLIDILFVKDNEFFILDWKTNEAPIRYDAGYFDKDIHGNMLNVWIPKDDTFNHPISYLPASTGNKYSMQLSGYAVQIEDLTGLRYNGSIICHIRTINKSEIVKFVNVVDLRKEFRAIGQHHYDNRKSELNYQQTLF